MQDKQLTRHNVPHNTVPYASQPTSNKQCTRNKIAPTLLPSGNQTRDRPLKNCNHQIMDTSTILTGQMQKYHSKIYDQTTTDPRTSSHHIYRQATSGYLYYPESRNGILPLQDKRKNQYSSSSKARTELLTSITDIRAIPNISAARILHCQGTWTSYIAIYGPKTPTHQWQSCGQTTCTIQLFPQ